MELYDWQAPDLVPLNAALNDIWTRWDQEGVCLANDLVLKCGDLLRESTTLSPAKTLRQRTRKALIGERWTPEEEDAYKRARKDMVDARKRLAEYARKTLKLKAVDLFAEAEPQKSQPELPAATPRTALKRSVKEDPNKQGIDARGGVDD